MQDTYGIHCLFRPTCRDGLRHIQTASYSMYISHSSTFHHCQRHFPSQITAKEMLATAAHKMYSVLWHWCICYWCHNASNACHAVRNSIPISLLPHLRAYTLRFVDYAARRKFRSCIHIQDRVRQGLGFRRDSQKDPMIEGSSA